MYRKKERRPAHRIPNTTHLATDPNHGGTTAPSEPRTPHCRGFTITTTHSVGLFWAGDQPHTETST